MIKTKEVAVSGNTPIDELLNEKLRELQEAKSEIIDIKYSISINKHSEGIVTAALIIYKEKK